MYVNRFEDQLRVSSTSRPRSACRELGALSGSKASGNALLFPNEDGDPLSICTMLRYCLHPAAEALALPKAGMRALRKGCNRRWESDGVSPAVTRQQMGHSDARMTTLYMGEIPMKDVQVAFSRVAYRGEKPQMENDLGSRLNRCNLLI